MQLEFYTPQPGTFKGTTYFRELGSDKYVPIEALDNNKQIILLHLFNDDSRIHKYIVYLRANNIITMSDILTRCIEKFFPKLDHIWDIDETKLNIETH